MQPSPSAGLTAGACKRVRAEAFKARGGEMSFVFILWQSGFIIAPWQLCSPSTSHLLYEFVHLLQGKVREVGLGVFSFLFCSPGNRGEKEISSGKCRPSHCATIWVLKPSSWAYLSSPFFLGLTLLILFWFYFIQSSGTRRHGEEMKENTDNSSLAASCA